MNPIQKVTLLLVLALCITVFTCWTAANSTNLSRERKIATYIVAIVAPVIGLLILAIFEYQGRRKS